jgi:hypothetical protein
MHNKTVGTDERILNPPNPAVSAASIPWLSFVITNLALGTYSRIGDTPLLQYSGLPDFLVI